MTTPPPSSGRPRSGMELAQEARQRTVERLDQQRRQRVNRMKTDFAQLMEPERELSRDLFEANFLPYFCGEHVGDVGEMKEVLTAWLHVASSPFHGVRLVENGKTIAIVPPIQDLSAFAPIKGAERRPNNAGAIVEMSAQRAGIDPVSSVGTMADGLTHRFLTSKFEPSPTLRKAWEALLAVFGKTLDPAKPAAAPSSSSQQSDEQLEDYD